MKVAGVRQTADEQQVRASAERLNGDRRVAQSVRMLQGRLVEEARKARRRLPGVPAAESASRPEA
jgi:hypothetical protein